MSSAVSNYYKSLRVISDIFCRLECHSVATLTSRRGVWMQCYTTVCFLLSRYELHGFEVNDSIIHQLKEFMGEISKRDAKGPNIENVRDVSKKSIEAAIRFEHGDHGPRHWENLRGNILPQIRLLLDVAKKFNADEMIDTAEFRSLVMNENIRFFASTNQELLISFVEILDQILWLDLHADKKVTPTEETLAGVKASTSRFFKCFSNWIYQNINSRADDMSVAVTKRLEIPSNMSSFLERIKEVSSPQSLSV